MRLSPVSARAITVLPSTIAADPRTVRTFAFLSSAPTPPVSRATIEILPADRLGEIELGRPDREPDRVQRPGLAERMRRVGGVDQRLRRNTADIEASSAEPVGFDKDRVEAELAGADGRDIAARPAADDENLAAKLVHSLAPKPGGLSPPRRHGMDTRFRGL